MSCCLRRVWDVHNKAETRKLDFSAAVNDIELSSDKRILTIAYSNKVAFWDIQTLVLTKPWYLAC